MRIDTETKQRLGQGDLSVMKDLIAKEVDDLTKTLKAATDILTVRYTQGQLNVLDKLYSALA